MTIHTKWMELLREEASDSFHRELGSGVVEASFIDGQIKLMKGDSIQTWSVWMCSFSWTHALPLMPASSHSGPTSSIPSSPPS